MIRIDAVAETLRSIVELMVKAPKRVRVTTETSRDTVGRSVTSFDIDVDETDRGRLIGRSGANMRAPRYGSTLGRASVGSTSALISARSRSIVGCAERGRSATNRYTIISRY